MAGKVRTAVVSVDVPASDLSMKLLAESWRQWLWEVKKILGLDEQRATALYTLKCAEQTVLIL